jgi:hypothetical protein
MCCEDRKEGIGEGGVEIGSCGLFANPITKASLEYAPVWNMLQYGICSSMNFPYQHQSCQSDKDRCDGRLFMITWTILIPGVQCFALTTVSVCSVQQRKLGFLFTICVYGFWFWFHLVHVSCTFTY